MGSRDFMSATSRPHQFANAIRYGVGRREQHRISGSGVARCNGPRLMTEQGCDGQVAVSEVGGNAGETMPKDVRRNVGGQARELDNARPMLCELGHRSVAAR